MGKDEKEKTDKKRKEIHIETTLEPELTEEELEKYSDELWGKGGFVRSMSSEEFEKIKDTIDKPNTEDMNFNCKKCNKKISAHNKDWHDNMCDDCFNKTYFPELK